MNRGRCWDNNVQDVWEACYLASSYARLALNLKDRWWCSRSPGLLISGPSCQQIEGSLKWKRCKTLNNWSTQSKKIKQLKYTKKASKIQQTCDMGNLHPQERHHATHVSQSITYKVSENITNMAIRMPTILQKSSDGKSTQQAFYILRSWRKTNRLLTQSALTKNFKNSDTSNFSKRYSYHEQMNPPLGGYNKAFESLIYCIGVGI